MSYRRHPKYRDELTEGYNIIPNFFISAKMDEKLSYADNVSATDREQNVFLSRHFKNRLFDRDTLLVYHYDVKLPLRCFALCERKCTPEGTMEAEGA